MKNGTSFRCRWIGLGVLVGVAVVGGCGSAKPTATPSPVLRGAPVSTFACPAQPIAPAAKPTPISGAQALRLCPLSAPGLRSKTVTVTSNQPLFATLIAALSAADEPATPGRPCPAYADLPQVVLAKTMSSAYQVSIPTDACGHYQRAALDMLHRARA